MIFIIKSLLDIIKSDKFNLTKTKLWIVFVSKTQNLTVVCV